MGFALATLPLLGLAAGIRLPALAPAMPHPAGAPAPGSSSSPFPYAILTLSKARSRRHARKNGTGASVLGGIPLGGTPLGGNLLGGTPLGGTPLTVHAAVPAPSAMARPPLRIVQHSPHEKPECLFISGRMADVCAALERMDRLSSPVHV